MKYLILTISMVLSLSISTFADELADVDNLIGQALNNIYGTALGYSGWENGNNQKKLTSCGLRASSEVHYKMSEVLSPFYGRVSVNGNILKELEKKIQAYFISFENERTKEGWYKVASSFTSILVDNSDNYYWYHGNGGMGNFVAIAQDNCLEKFGKMPQLELNTNLDVKGKLGNVKLGDTITNFTNFSGEFKSFSYNYGKDSDFKGVYTDTSNVKLKKEIDWYLNNTNSSNESYLGFNKFIAKDDIEFVDDQVQFNDRPIFRIKGLQIGNLNFNIPVAYISPSTKKVYAIEMTGQLSEDESKELVGILNSAYGKWQMSNTWFSSSRIMYLEKDKILMIDIPLYLDHIKWVENQRTKLNADKQDQVNAKKKEAANFFK